MKNIAILGSTGSIGRSALSIIETYPDLFTISALAANTSVDLIEQQARQFHTKLVALYDQNAAKLLQQRLSDLKSVAINELTKRGIKVDGFTHDERTNRYTLLTTDFSTMLKESDERTR